MSIPRLAHCGVRAGRNVFIFGGSSESAMSQPVASADMFSLDDEKWTSIAPMNVGRAYFSCVHLDGKIYVMGGLIFMEQTSAEQSGMSIKLTKSMEIYDIKSNTWTEGSPLPRKLASQSAIVDGGFIYLFGGAERQDESRSTVYRYSPKSDEWLEMEGLKLPKAREDFCFLQI
eukprot:TRINITY_DN406_c0_g1_i1.p1 TRINITY_DN406_c0_g1~~TRINITY_DN406_c0_g1_i1.p1  ORF type:complete len:193 (-),score=49.92 TRINITY_DN406_c0_g1_i1:111-629(-)